MNYLKFLFFFLLLFTVHLCNAGILEIKQQKTRAQIDSLNASLDDESTDGFDYLDSLKQEDVSDLKTEIALSKYYQYRKAAPLTLNLPNQVFADIVDIERSYFLNQNYAYQADSVINAIPDKLKGKSIVLIDGLLQHALYMLDSRNFGSTDIVNDVVIRPGIKYGWGLKEIDKKYNPSEESRLAARPSTCDHFITGLDCSGFIYQLFKMSGIKFPNGNADNQRKTGTIQTHLSPYFENSSRFIPTDLGNLPPDKIESGDIIYFFSDTTQVKAVHIGIALKTAAGVKFFHSSGDRNNCARNISDRGGVQCVNITGYLKSRPRYGVVRMVLGAQ